MVLAQGLAEYGAMAGLAATFQSGMVHAQTLVRDLGPQEYLVIAVVGVVLLRVFSRRS